MLVEGLELLMHLALLSGVESDFEDLLVFRFEHRVQQYCGSMVLVGVEYLVWRLVELMMVVCQELIALVIQVLLSSGVGAVDKSEMRLLGNEKLARLALLQGVITSVGTIVMEVQVTVFI